MFIVYLQIEKLNKNMLLSDLTAYVNKNMTQRLFT